MSRANERGAGVGQTVGGRRPRWRCAAAVVLVGTAARGGAQGAPERVAVMPVAASSMRADTARAAGAPGVAAHTRAADVAATAGLIVLGAAGAQLLHTPSAWPRTAGGFGRRVADQTGFYVLQAAGERALGAGLGWRDDDAPCATIGAANGAASDAAGDAASGGSPRGLLPLAACAVARTFVAVDGRGVRRAHVPRLASVVAATLASVAWRPERRATGTATAFVATRLGVVFTGFAGERLLVEWRRRGARAR